VKLRVVFRRQASEELLEAARNYDQKSLGLGADFVEEVEVLLERVVRHPEMYPVVERDARRGLLRRFPYAVFYLVTDDAVVVLAVFNCTREPGSWRR